VSNLFSQERGFTLLEAMVALVIFSLASMGIYGWINANLISLNRLADLAANEQVLNSAVERLKLVDMSKETEGAFNVDDYNVQWHADLVEPWHNGVTAAGAITIYDLGLYDVKLIFVKDGRERGHFSYRNTAYKKMREPPKLEGDNL
jgi:general secretion pathway protein I